MLHAYTKEPTSCNSYWGPSTIALTTTFGVKGASGTKSVLKYSSTNRVSVLPHGDRRFCHVEARDTIGSRKDLDAREVRLVQSTHEAETWDLSLGSRFSEQRSLRSPKFRRNCDLISKHIRVRVRKYAGVPTGAVPVADDRMRGHAVKGSILFLGL